MSETTTPFELWWEEEPVGARFVLHEPAQDLAEKGWNAALEWAAGQVGNKCTLLPGCGINAISTIGGSRPDRERHDPRCPIALAAKIREGGRVLRGGAS